MSTFLRYLAVPQISKLFKCKTVFKNNMKAILKDFYCLKNACNVSLRNRINFYLQFTITQH